MLSFFLRDARELPAISALVVYQLFLQIIWYGKQPFTPSPLLIALLADLASHGLLDSDASTLFLQEVFLWWHLVDLQIIHCLVLVPLFN